MKLKPSKIGFSGISTAVAGFAAIAAIGGASAAQHPPVRTVTTQRQAATARLDAYTQTASDTDYTVRSGDTLAVIAGREYGSAQCWPGIYSANSGSIRDPNMIYVGQRLRIPGGCGTRGPVRTVTVTVSKTTPDPGSGGNEHESSFEECVIRSESGGDPDIWNASGHWGLFQFSESTWVGYGGPASEFGSASAAEQVQVFNNAMATPGGADNWSPYDHCTV